MQQRRGRSSPWIARTSGSRRDHQTHAIQFSETGSRTRSPLDPEKGSSRIFSLLLLFYYNFIVIQIHCSDPGKEIHARYLHLYYNTYTHRVLSNRPRHNQETPSLRAIVSTQTQILRRQWSGVRVILIKYYIYNYVHLNLTYCRQITRATRYILVLLTDVMPPGRRRRS